MTAEKNQVTSYKKEYTGFSLLSPDCAGKQNFRFPPLLAGSSQKSRQEFISETPLYILCFNHFFNVIISGCCQVMPKVRIATTGLFVTLPVIRLETRRPRAPAAGTEQDLQIT